MMRALPQQLPPSASDVENLGVMLFSLLILGGRFYRWADRALCPRPLI
jgi:hypothetical protein